MLVVVAGAVAQPSMEAPAEVKKLDWMLGTWKGDFNWVQEGMKSEGTMTYTSVMDGQFQRTTSVIEMMGMKMTESSFMGWDAKKKKYFMYTFSNFSPMPRIDWGDLVGDKMVLISEPWDTGQGEPTISRGTMSKDGADSASLLLEFKIAGKWTKVGEGKFKRVK